METDEDFLDCDALQDVMMITAIKGCKKFHIFTVSMDDSNTLHMQEADGEATVALEVVRPQYQGDIDWRKSMMTLNASEPPGLPDIKWVALYSKSG